MPRKPAKFLKSEFLRTKSGEPVELRATEKGIEVDVFFDEHEKAFTVLLTPHHLEAIVSMHKDWWESHWSAIHEEQA